MFLWGGIAHMALPLGKAGVQQIDKEDAMLTTLQSTLSTPGFYMFPKMTPATPETEYQKKVATGPSGMMIYFPSRDFSFGKSLAIELVRKGFGSPRGTQIRTRFWRMANSLHSLDC
jgi:hypothetical protein